MTNFRRLSILCSGIPLLLAGCGTGTPTTSPVPSWHALYTEKDLVVDPSLEGEWVAKDAAEHLVFTRKSGTGDAASLAESPAMTSGTNQPAPPEIWRFERDAEHAKHYKLTLPVVGKADEGGQTETNEIVFDACLLKLADSRFLDLKLAGTDLDLFEAQPGLARVPERGLGLLWGSFVILPAHCFLKVFQTQPTLEVGWLNDNWLEDLLKKHPRAVKHETVGEGDNKRLLLTASTKELQRFIRRYAKAREPWVIQPPQTNRPTAGPGRPEQSNIVVTNWLFRPPPAKP